MGPYNNNSTHYKYRPRISHSLNCERIVIKTETSSSSSARLASRRRLSKIVSDGEVCENENELGSSKSS